MSATGPIGGVIATRYACMADSTNRSGVVASSSNFTKSRMMAPMSCALCGALMMPVGLRCSPTMRKTGTRSAQAWNSAIDACSIPTVPCTMTTIGLPDAFA